MKTVSSHKLVAFLGLSLLSAHLFAEPDAQTPPTAIIEEHVPIDSRPLSPEAKKMMVEKRIAELEETDPEASELSAQRPLPVPPLVPPMPYEECALALGDEKIDLTPIIPIRTQRFALLTSDQMIQATGNGFSPYLYHWLDSYPGAGGGFDASGNPLPATLGNVLKLEDASEWTFSTADAHIVRSWRKGDTLVIAPKMTWLWGSEYCYTLTNRTLNVSIDVNMSKGSKEFGPYSAWIVGIDYYNGHVHLINGQGERMTFVISNTDYYLFKDWKVNDHVFVASNDNWMYWFSPFNHCLININMNHYVRAKTL